jgi:1-deoxy-D-xylulose-5-phosphate synthase
MASVRFPRGEGYGVPLDSSLKMLQLGASERLVETGRPTVVIWAAGSCVYPAVEAAKDLEKLGVIVDVVNARFIKPLDVNALLRDAGRAKLIVTVEENAVIGGLGSAVLEALAENNKIIPVVNLGIPDQFIEHGAQSRLRAESEIDQGSIVRKTLERLESLSLTPGKKTGAKEVVKSKTPENETRITH